MPQVRLAACVVQHTPHCLLNLPPVLNTLLRPPSLPCPTDQTHSCCRKACMVAGILHLRQLTTCAQQGYAMQPAALEAAVQADLAAGLLPCFVCATIGTTGCCAVDPVADLAPVARRHGIW